MSNNKYTKEQLLAADEAQLRDIATLLNLPAQALVREDLIYAILDAQAVALSASDAPEAPKRRRITVKTPDHVYSATQSGRSERFDSAKDERAAKRAVAAKAKEADALATQALLAADGQEELPKRRRGRPTKEEAAARKAFEEMKERQAQLPGQTQAVATDAAPSAPVSSSADVVASSAASPSDAPVAASETSAPASTPSVVTPDSDLPDFIVAQMAQQPAEFAPAVGGESLADFYRQRTSDKKSDTPTESKAQRAEVAEIAAGGADFIIVEDIPVVDNDIMEVNVPYDRPEPDYAVEESAPTRFRRFKDDTLVNARRPLNAITNTIAQLSQSRPAAQDIVIDGCGVLELDQQGVGFLRSSDYNYMPSPDDIYVSQAQVRNYALKMGDVVECKVKVPREGEKYFSLLSVERINGLAPHEVRDRVAFEHLTPLFPDEQFKLSTGRNSPLACRVVDLFSPIGKGQRALIVAQPKTGKTILMKQIANAIAANYPDTYLMMLLVDERPEEVTDMERTVKAEVIASTFDEPAARHVRIAQMVLEKAKRMVECGHDVVIFLDSITRLARAFNTVAPTSGKILTGGVDANALQRPKRFFGAARNIENGGSLTIIATALIDTGSKMDEVIFEEFKGTGNMELQLDRSLANKRIFPAVNLIQSSTRRDDLLFDETTLNRMYILRNYMADMSSMEAMEFVRKRIENTLSNEEFLLTMNR